MLGCCWSGNPIRQGNPFSHPRQPPLFKNFYRPSLEVPSGRAHRKRYDNASLLRALSFLARSWQTSLVIQQVPTSRKDYLVRLPHMFLFPVGLGMRLESPESPLLL